MTRSQTSLSSIIPAAALLVAGMFSAVPAKAEDLSDWRLPPVPIPADNPQTDVKVKLGHQLAFDSRLSKNQSMSCAGCHLPFAGGGGHTARAFGHGGELGRWAPTWVNSGYSEQLFWDGRAKSLEEQTGALIDAKGNHMGPLSAPPEMGGDISVDVKLLNSIPEYKAEFNKAFGEDATPGNIAKAIAAYERTLVAFDSPFQHYVNGNKKAISAAAKRGFDLFRNKAMCSTCHTAPLMTDNMYHNIGVPQVGPLKEDLGRYAVTKDKADKGAFKTPTLYNSTALTFFMHDGAFSTMEQVIDHYNMGGDPKNPNQSALIQPLKLTAREKSDLIAFLKTLNDDRLNHIHRPAIPGM